MLHNQKYPGDSANFSEPTDKTGKTKREIVPHIPIDSHLGSRSIDNIGVSTAVVYETNVRSPGKTTRAGV